MMTQQEIIDMHEYLSLALHGDEGPDLKIDPIPMLEKHREMLYAVKTTLCLILGCGGPGPETLKRNMDAIRAHFAAEGIERVPREEPKNELDYPSPYDGFVGEDKS